MKDLMPTGQVETYEALVTPSVAMPCGLENPPSVERDCGGGQSMSDWRKTTVGKISDGFLSGGTPDTSRTDYWAGEIPWITSKWLGDKLELTCGEKFISVEAVNKTAAKIVPKNSIIFATRVGVGKVGINRIDLAINQDIAGVLIDNEKYDIKFLAYQLSLDSIQQYVAMNKRGATIKGITRDCLEQIRLNIPPLPEQKKIAHILSTVQRAIEAQERIIQTTTELKKALMHKLFTEGLRNEPQKETEIGLVPESWEVVEIGDVFKFTSGKTKPMDTLPEPSVERTVPVYGGNGVLGYSAQSLLDEDVLILGRVGEYCGCAHLTRPISWVTDNALYVKEEKRSVNRSYTRVHFEHLNLNQYSNKMGQPLITQGIINRVKFGLPSRKEQDEIANAFEALDTRIDQIKAKRNCLQNIFRTLLHELMTAKTRVNQIKLPAA
jgi:type I restriction enzyme S subunit